jgi:hypothetical protein
MSAQPVVSREVAVDDKRVEQLTGHIHARTLQMLYWSLITGAVFAAFVAGLYFGILQCNWHVFSLKAWWDGLFHQAWWPTYRHTAFRDIPEPAFAIMGALTALAKPKQWAKRVSTLKLVTAPLVMAVATFALGIAGTWLLNYAFGHPILASDAAGNLSLGFIIGRILHVYWGPVGATFQGQLLDGPAERAARRRRLPKWVRRPYAPPQLRERMAVMYLNELSPDVTTPGAPSRLRRWLLVIGVIMFILIAALGIIGHYWVGTNHTIPYIQPLQH